MAAKKPLQAQFKVFQAWSGSCTWPPIRLLIKFLRSTSWPTTSAAPISQYSTVGFHLIKFSTSKTVSEEAIIKPLLAYFNDSEYFNIIKEQYLENTSDKMRANDSTITQINTLLNDFSKSTATNQKSDKLIYYNENNNLNDIIKTKTELEKENLDLKFGLINNDKVVKDISVATNIINTKGTKGKMKLILPIFFVFVFLFFHLFRNFYKDQLQKRNQQ